MKVRISKKKSVNEFLGGLFSRNSTTSKSKGLSSGAAARDFNQLRSRLELSDNKIGKEKLKSLGISLTDLYAMIDQTTKLFSGGVGSLRAMNINKTQAAINLLKQDYDDVVQKAKQKKLTQNEANEVIAGIISIATTIFKTMPPMMEGEQIDEALGMQRRALEKFFKNLKFVDAQGNPTLSSPVEKTKIDADSAAAQKAMVSLPPPPPADVEKTPAVQQSAKPVAQQQPGSIKMSAEEKQDKVNTYSKIASKYVQTKLNRMVTPEDAKKVVQALMNKNYLKESNQYSNLIDAIAKEAGMDKEIVKAIFDSLQNSFSGELEKMHLDSEREQFSGMGTNESLNEHIINRNKQEIFNEKDSKRYKLLAGLS